MKNHLILYKLYIETYSLFKRLITRVSRKLAGLFYPGKKSKYSLIKSFFLEIERLMYIVDGHMGDKKMGKGVETDVDVRYYEDNMSRNKDAYSYTSVRYAFLEKIFDYLKITGNEVLADLGSGKGRIVMFAARKGVKEAVGVELNNALIDVSQNNIAGMKGAKAPITFINMDVGRWAPSNITVFFLSNPFGEKTFRKVMENIKMSLNANPRKIRIVYYRASFASILNGQDWLEYEGQIGKTDTLVWHNKR